MGPFLDLDTPAADILPRRRAAQNALVLCLRSWSGIAVLASEDMSLPALVRVLADTKVRQRSFLDVRWII